MTDITPQTFYADQSRITDPAAQVDHYRDLPRDLARISQVVQGLVLHYFADKHLYDYPPERTNEINTRYVADILARINELHAAPLTTARPPSTRIIGCCRDFTALAVSMLRHAGIPARSRYGFGAYFVPGYYFDHVVVEFWNGTDWQLADPQLNQAHYPFDVLNVPRDQFVVGGQAWQMCRIGKANPERFGLGPDDPVSGWWFIQGRMLLDLAALNKLEMLCWDEWSYGDAASEGRLTEDDLALLDHLSAVSQQGDAGFDELRRLFSEDARLRLPETFQSFNPAENRPVEVRLR
jgi:hypothetical protein